MRDSRHGNKWLTRIEGGLITPMLRYGENDYFVDEAALLKDHRAVMVTRWFTRRVNASLSEMCGRAWLMSPVTKGSDREMGWLIKSFEEILFKEEDLLMNQLRFTELHDALDLPDPNEIWGAFRTSTDLFEHADFELRDSDRTKQNDSTLDETDVESMES